MQIDAVCGWQQVVREWLREEERSQAWLCRKAGLDTSVFSRQMTGRRRISDCALRKIEDVLCLKPGTLVSLRIETEARARREADGNTAGC